MPQPNSFDLSLCEYEMNGGHTEMNVFLNVGVNPDKSQGGHPHFLLGHRDLVTHIRNHISSTVFKRLQFPR